MTAESARVNLEISWRQVGEIGGRLSSCLDGKGVELVIGIARGGLPYAVAISHALSVKAFGTIHLDCAPAGKSAAFDPVSGAVSLVASALPDGNFNVIAVVDDMIGWGETMAQAERVITERYLNRPKIYLVSPFIDRRRFARGPMAGRMNDVISDREIDNARVWVSYPWER